MLKLWDGIEPATALLLHDLPLSYALRMLVVFVDEWLKKTLYYRYEMPKKIQKEVDDGI